jgi:GWxTD domain-containing protein
MRRAAHLLMVVALLQPAAAPAAGPAAAARGGPKTPAEYDAPTKRWREGPVRYLLSHDEDRAYRRLRTGEERLRFIRDFWARRDTDPATPANEYRNLFYRRVADAVRLLSESTTPGWKTDRGKIYILMGPPDDEEKQRRGASLEPDVILWRYRNLPTKGGLGPNPTIRFVRDPTGAFHLSDRIFLNQQETPLGVGLETQAMLIKSQPPPAEFLAAILGAGSYLDTGPYHSQADYFRAADGGTYTVLTLAVRRSALEGVPDPARIEAAGRLVGDAPPGKSYDLAGPAALRRDDAAPHAGQERRETTGGAETEYHFFQAGLTLPPGGYTIYYGVADPVTGKVFPFKERLEVPEISADRLTVGTIKTAARLERTPGPFVSLHPAPFVLGNLKVTPRPDADYRNGDELAFYYPVYGFATDPIDGRPDLDVEYRFEQAAGPDGWTRLGTPVRLTRQRDPVHGYAMRLTDWRPGDYRVTVAVTDNLGGRQARAEITFRVQ